MMKEASDYISSISRINWVPSTKYYMDHGSCTVHKKGELRIALAPFFRLSTCCKKAKIVTSSINVRRSTDIDYINSRLFYVRRNK